MHVPHDAPYHGLCPQRPRPRVHGRAAHTAPVRLSDLILAVLGVFLLGDLALVAAYALAMGPATP